MQFLSRLKVRGRLVLGFLVVFTLVTSSSALGIWRVTDLGTLVDELVSDHADKLVQAMVWERVVAVNLVRARNELLTDDPAIGARIAEEIEAGSRQITGLQKKIEASATSAEDKEALAAMAERRGQYRELRDQLRRHHADGKDVSSEVTSSLEKAAGAYLESIEHFVAMNEQDLANGRAAAEAAVKRTRALMLALVAVGLLVALAFAAAITRSIVDPLRRAQADALRIASGDLTVPIEARGHDEIADLLRAAAQMQGSLRDIAKTVRQSSEATASAATQIAAASTDLSSRTEEQAASLEETAASIEQMTATVNQTAQNTTQADGLAVAAAEVARRGGDAVDEVVRMMSSIQSASRKIGDIIGLIDSIAFQTNILALNAAVEAARAGQQGRGFAVVASVGRSLAQRSAEAAKEIKALITHSVAEVDAGARLAGDAGSTMSEVVESVSRVSKIIGDIAAAAVEQSTGIAQVNRAVADLDKVTQQNAALVQESMAAGESLKSLSSELVQAVSVFRIAEEEVDPPPKTSGARPVKSTTAKALPIRTAIVAPSRLPKGDDEWTQF